MNRHLGFKCVVLVVVLLVLNACGSSGDSSKSAKPPFAVGTANSVWKPEARETNGLRVVRVPAGCFMMGTDDWPDSDWASDARPAYKVCVSEFWIGETEVTNAQYRACVEAGSCPPPTLGMVFYEDPAYADHPVSGMGWEGARAYAEWAGCALPSEAQWEYAARGPEGREFPWGRQVPDASLANLGLTSVGKGTTPVGSYPAGASWVGALDMSGNAWEWVADWYGPYSAEEQQDPTGPASGRVRVMRGGAWNMTLDMYARTHYRSAQEPNPPADGFYGFRVACTLPPAQ